MTPRRRVFVDTWAWLALASDDDAAHQQAYELHAGLQRDAALYVTSELVLAEAMTRLRYDAGLAAALFLAESVGVMTEARALDLVFIEAQIWSSALAWLRRFDDHAFSMVDCTSFAIMAQLGLQEALTSDHHFAIAGFTPLGR